MQNVLTTRRNNRTGLGIRALACALMMGLFAVAGNAQVSSYGEKSAGENRGDELPQVPEGWRLPAFERTASAECSVSR